MKKTLAIIACLAVLIAALPAAAANYPRKPITAYVPLAAGGTTDVFVRTIAPYMEKVLGKPLILVNKPGSGGAVAISTPEQGQARRLHLLLGQPAHSGDHSPDAQADLRSQEVRLHRLAHAL